MAKYKRILLKLSGEALAGPARTGFDEATCLGIAAQVKQLADDGIQIGVVTGGGNFWRGRTSQNMDRAKADQIGTLATVMNCIYVSEMFRSVGLSTKVLTPFPCSTFTEVFSKDNAIRYMEEGIVSFFAGGTGHPYFSTDTAVVLRAVEMEADIILAGRAVDGVYDSDPAVNPDAKKYDEIDINQVINQRLGVIDLTAAALCMENHMPMMIFGLNEENSIVNTVRGVTTGTLVTA